LWLPQWATTGENWRVFAPQANNSAVAILKNQPCDRKLPSITRFLQFENRSELLFRSAV
jgi:hypothetical protein